MDELGAQWEGSQLYTPLPYASRAQLGSSSGAEDYFMSGFDWRGGPCFAHELAGAWGLSGYREGRGGAAAAVAVVM